MSRILTSLLLLSLMPAVSSVVVAEEVRVAVASNFLHTLRQLAPRFESASGHRLRISSGSTGKLYAQIRHGAPYDIFLAADRERPQRLIEEGRADPSSHYDYAFGRLVLWAPGERDGCRQRLESGRFDHLAIANPKIAPYGRAAREWLERIGIWQKLHPKLVRGENIAQALQFVESGNAEMGVIAFSLVTDREEEGCLWPVPADQHRSLAQQGVALNGAGAGAYAFLDYLRSEPARRLIAGSGYGTE